jgi:hypothetical protein
MTRFIAVLVLLVALPPASTAGEAYARFTVTAQVVSRVSLETLDQPPSFTVTGTDLERGYVDLNATYRVRNNDPAGYVLLLSPRTALAGQVTVTGLGSPVTAIDDVVEVAQPASMTPSQVAIRIRVHLAPGFAPGEYPLPVALTAATL